MRDVFVTGWSAFLPNAPIDNTQIEAVLGALPDQPAAVKRRILMNNGITSRHYAIDPITGRATHNNAELTAEAVRRLCLDFRFDIHSISCLACGTSCADQLIPSHASMVHAALACTPCETLSATGVCCSGVSALKYGHMNVAAGSAENAVVTGSEWASPTLHASHFSKAASGIAFEGDAHSGASLPFGSEFLRWMLSDGAGALLLQPKPKANGISLRVDWVDLLSFANESEICMHYGMRKNSLGASESYRTVPFGADLMADGYFNLSQDVKVLNEQLPRLMRVAMKRTIERRELCADNIDWMLPHYSSQWFRQKLYDGLAEIGFEIPSERWFTNLTTKGNTGAAAFYIMLEELLAGGGAQRGQHILAIVPESARMTFGFLHFTVV